MPKKSSVTLDAKKPVLLVVSFGSSYNNTRESTIGAIEKALQQANPEYEVRRAFTSRFIINILAKRENLEIDNVSQALQRLVNDGIKQVVIQPTHIMSGKEYNDIIAETKFFAEKFESIKIGTPLLTNDDDFTTLVNTLIEETAKYSNTDTSIVYVGHGTHHSANETYLRLQNELIQSGYHNYFIGTLKSKPTLEDVMASVKEKGAKKVVLLPLMIAAGEHACIDMAGDQKGSWKFEFEKSGYQVECIFKGLGQYSGVLQMFIDHAAKAKS